MTGDHLLGIATWNIRDARGPDGERDVECVAKVIGKLNVPWLDCKRSPVDREIFAMPAAGHQQWSSMARHPDTRSATKQHGNALLSLLPVEEVRLHDLSFQAREPRGALEARMWWGTHRLRVLVTHLGLRACERRWQVERLLASVERVRDAGARDASDHLPVVATLRRPASVAR